MRTLIVEDEFISRVMLQEMLSEYGVCHIAVNGKEAVGAVEAAMKKHEPYDLVCLDVVMPELDGHQALEQIRQLEDAAGISFQDRTKIVMVTADSSLKSVNKAFGSLCDAYLVKPLDKNNLVGILAEQNLI